MELRTNAEDLLRTCLVGEIPPTEVDRQPYAPGTLVDPFLLPGMGGVTLVRIGERAFGWAADHLEPGAKVHHPEERANNALQFLACVGNRAQVLSGLAVGARGFVTGKHANVMVDFPRDVLERLAVGDRIAVEAVGVGLRFLDHPDVVAKNLAPSALGLLGASTLPDGSLGVPVRKVIPREAMGAGVGMHSDYANCDLMFRSFEDARRLGLTDLLLGDVVALEDQDHRFGRGYRQGAWTIATVTTGMCQSFGHGPGATTLLTGPPGTITPLQGTAANFELLAAALAQEGHPAWL